MIKESDIYKLLSLFDSFGVGYTVEEENYGVKKTCVYLRPDVACWCGGSCEENCDIKPPSKVVGYPGFFSYYEFNEHGEFIEIGISE